MKTWTVHLRPGPPGADPDFVLVREGFVWLAFLFGPLWILGRGLWLVFVLYCTVLVPVGLVMDFAGEVGEAVIGLVFTLLTGFSAHDLWRWTLDRRRYVQTGLVVAPDRAAAELRAMETGLVPSAKPRALPVTGWA